MKYLFGDSTEFPLQIDFVRLLDDFIDTSVQTITLENTVIDLKKTIINRQKLKNSVLEEMSHFLLIVENAISEAVAKSKEQDTIVKYADKSKDFLREFTKEGKTKFSDEISKEITQLEKEIEDADNKNRKTLEPFFIKDPIDITNKTYTVKATENGHYGYSTKVRVDHKSGISTIYDIAASELPFWNKHVKVDDFATGIEIPVKMKKPFLKSEFVPDIINVDNYFLNNIALSGKDLDIVFSKKRDTDTERLRLKMNFTDNFLVDVYYAEDGAEKNIQEIQELKDALNTSRLRELGEKIIEQTDTLYSKRQELEYICLNGKDAIAENVIFELSQRVAKILSSTVADIKQHSPSKEELSIKEEDERGKRREMYLKKSHIKERLDIIKDKGTGIYEALSI